MPLSFKPGFGDKLKYYIETDLHGRSRNQIAKLIKRKASTLHRWITETQQIPYNDLIWLSRILALSTEQRAELLDLAGYEVDTPLIASQTQSIVRRETRAQYQPGFGRQARDYIDADTEGRTQRELAKAIDCSATDLNHWLAERRQIPFNALYRFCHSLQLDVAARAKLVQLAGYEVDLRIGQSAPDATQVPFQIPPRPTHFVGREPELNALIIRLQEDKIITLCGPGGIGKSALASEAVWRLIDNDHGQTLFPDGVIYHNFYNHHQVTSALQHIVESFGEAPHPTPDQAVLRTLSQKQALLLLDGVEDADDLPRLLAARGKCTVLITSRRRADTVEDWITIPALTRRQSLALLQKWAKSWVVDQAAAEEICALLGGLPLAVRLVGRYLAQCEEEAATYLIWLRDTPLQALNQGQRRQDSVPLLLERSLERISHEAQLALCVIGQLALAPVADADLERPLEWPRIKTRSVLSELVSYGLLIRSEKQFEVSHALIHTFSRRQTLPDVIRERLVNDYVQFAIAQGKRASEGYPQFAQRLPHLLAVLEGCILREDWLPALTIVVNTQNYLDAQGRWAERLSTLQLGLKAAQALNDRAEEARLLGVIGLTYRDLRDYSEAIIHIEQGLAVARTANNQEQEAFCLGNLGLIYQDTAQHAKALDTYKRAVALSNVGNHKSRLGYQLVGVATQLRVVGETVEAIDYLQQAQSVAVSTQDRRLLGMSLTGLGATYRHLLEPTQAVTYCLQALTIAEKMRDIRRKGAYLGNLAMAYYSLEQYSQAEKHLREAIAIAKQIEDRREESNHLGRLGLVLCALDDPEQSLDLAQEALSIAQIIEDRYREGNHLGVLGLAYRLQGNFETAIEWSTHALSVARELSDRRGEAYHLYNLGLTFQALKNYNKAQNFLIKALWLFQDLDPEWTEMSKRKSKAGEDCVQWGT